MPGFEVAKPAGTVNAGDLAGHGLHQAVPRRLDAGAQVPRRARRAAGGGRRGPRAKVLATTGNGKLVEFLTTDKVLTKFKEKFIDGKKSEFIDDDGNVIQVPGAQYDEMNPQIVLRQEDNELADETAKQLSGM